MSYQLDLADTVNWLHSPGAPRFAPLRVKSCEVADCRDRPAADRWMWREVVAAVWSLLGWCSSSYRDIVQSTRVAT